MNKADNIIAFTSNQAATMSSLEIADLTGKRHDSVKRTIETIAEKGAIRLPQIVISEKNNNLGLPQKTKHYVFSGEQGKRDSIIVVAQLSPEFTARLVDRWQELEEQARKIAKPKKPTRRQLEELVYEQKIQILEQKNELLTIKLQEAKRQLENKENPQVVKEFIKVHESDDPRKDLGY